MTTPPKILHFTLGPVQGFIGDARRTRDFWAGSFLLSWLSGHAMAALDKADGEIVFPQVGGDELFEAIKSVRAGKTPATLPYIGSLPNRFKADVSAVNGDAGKICKDAIEKVWTELADKVWDNFVKDDEATLGKGGTEKTQEIWDRQVKGFWDINWVVGPPDFDDNKNPVDGKWLDERKNWRSHWQKDEPGDLCRLMGKYQELSGYHRISNKQAQGEFWDKLAKNVGTLNLRDNEYLCAIALIKRLFPLIAEDVIGWQPGGGKMDIVHWPSVSYIAAVPWLKAAAELDNKKQSEYWKNAHENLKTDFMGETHTKLFGLPKNGLFKLDGHLLHEDGIRAWKQGDFKDGEQSRINLTVGLKEIQKKIGGKASEFYAVLIMDGDRIGAKIAGHEETVSNGLAAFTKSVKDYFNPNHQNKNPSNGVLIYAGGDDVLAFVPVDTAIRAAQDLQEKYEGAFNGADEKFTMSAAIVFAQYKIPLSAVLKQAHHYLDNIAKDKNGRNSLALAVMKPGGIASDWVTKWGGKVGHMLKVAKDGNGKKGKFSNNFFYNIKERYAPLFEEKQAGEFADEKFMEPVLAAEYKKQQGKSKLSFAQAKDITVPILSIGFPERGDGKKPKGFDFNAVLVAKFLATEARWHLNGNKNGEGSDG